MAGIITSVAEDIKKLQELKKAISDVKKELGSINITVDIDIKENLEKQLQSLMAQYNGMEEKISQVEGKMMLLKKDVQKAIEVQKPASDISKLITDGLKEIEQSSQKTSQSVESLNSTLNHNDSEVEKNTQALNENVVATEKVRVSHTQLVAEINHIASTNYDKFINRTTEGTLNYSNAINQANLDMARLTSVQDDLNELWKSGEISAEEYQRTMNEVQVAIVRTEQAFDALRDARNSKKGVSVDTSALDGLDEKIHLLLLDLAELEVENGKTKQSLKDLNKEFKDGSVTEDDYIRRKAILQNSLDEESKKIKEVKTELKLQRQAVGEVEGSYNQLSAQYSLNKVILNKLSSEQLQDTEEYKKLLEETEAIYEKMKQYQASTGKNQLNVGNYESGFTNARVELRALVTEIAGLTLQYRNMSDAEKAAAEGQELKEKIDQLTGHAAELKDAIGDVNDSIKKQASDTSSFDAIADGINLLISGFGLAEGAAQMLGLSEEDLVAVQTNLQAAFVASNAIVKIQTSLRKESALMTGIHTLQTNLATTAINIRTAAEGKGIIATKAATVAQAAFNAVAKANPYVLLAAAVISVVGALWAFTKGQKEAAKADEERKEALEKAKNELKEYNEAIASGAAKNISKLEELRREWVALGGNMSKQKQFIEDNKDAFHDLGLEVNSVSDVENILVKNTAAVKKAFMERAKAAAAASLMEQKYKEIIQINLQKETKVITPKVGRMMGWSDAAMAREKAKRQAEERAAVQKRNAERDAQIKAIEKQIDELADVQLEGNQKAKSTLKGAGVKEYDKEAEKRKNSKKKKTEQQRKEAEKKEREKQQAEYVALLDKQKYETIKKQRDNEYEIRQNTIDIKKEGNEKALAQINLDYDRQKAAIKDYEDKLKQEKIDAAKAAFEKNPANKDKVFDAGGVDVKMTEQETRLVKSMRDKADHEREQSIKDLHKAELQSMRDYLKEYGTVQQQKYAIAKEYDEKIAKVEGEAQKKLLERQKQEALSNIVSKDAMMSIDWRETFGNMGSVLQDIAKTTLAKVDEYMKSDSFKNLEAKDKKAYADLRSNLRSSVNNDNINVFSTKMWDEISTYAEKYKNSVKALQDATKKHELAIDGLEKAEEELSKATTDEAKKIAKKKVESAKKEVSNTATEVQTQQQNVNNDKGDLDDSAGDAAIALQNFQALLSNITSGSLTGFAKGIGQLINGIAGGSTKVGDALQGLGGKIGGLVGAILSIIEALGDDPAGFIDNLFNKIVTAVEGILTNLDKIALSIVKGVGNLTGGIIRATLSGATFGLYNANGNVEEMNKRIEELKSANEELAKSIKDLAESISDNDSTNKDSVEAYKKAVAAQKESNENQQEAIRAEASKYSNSGHGFLGMGGRKSFNKYANDNRSNWLPQFNEALRKSGYNAELNDVSQVWNLTAEQLKAIRSNAPKAWSAFFNSGGEGNPKELVEEYIDSAAGALDELTDKLNEKLTGYSWNGFKQNYESLLSDLESTTEDFGDNISEIINKALVNSFVNSPEMQSRIKNLYSYISDAASDGIFTNKEVGEIRRQNEEIANYGIQWRQAMEEAGIIQKKSSSSSEASGSINTAKGITDDTANELVGRVTAVELTEERLAAGQQQQFIALTQISGNISAMVNQVSGIHNIADETRSILANSYMELQQINENTREVVKPIKLMQSDIAEMKRKL